MSHHDDTLDRTGRQARQPQDLHNADPPHGVGNSSDALPRVVEHLTWLFTESGLARMPARVLAYMLVAGDDRYTARQLADGLQVSLAAVSGALPSLVRSGLLTKERAPGARADTYHIYDDVWSGLLRQRDPLLQRREDILRELSTTLGSQKAERRLLETLEFVRFSREIMRRAADEWKQRRHLSPWATDD